MSVYVDILRKVRIWGYSKLIVGEHAGIKLVDISSNKSNAKPFIEHTSLALDLISRIDPLRFARVTRYIDYIVNLELYSGGRYCPGKICQIDYGRMNFSKYPDWFLYLYASAIVHEATHGYIQSKGIIRTSANGMDIERICVTEENHFLSKIQSFWGKRLLRSFDPKKCEYGSGLRRLTTMLRRMKEERIKAQQSGPAYPPQGVGSADP